MIGKFGPFEFTLSERYRFEEELGRGAMGTVYRAKDVRLGRPVAIKILHPALTNELGVSRFQSEIRIAASLHHPNIVGVHESGEADGRLFYVMDYLGGETLRARLKREKQLSPEDALKIVDDLAEGLQYAHDHGVVHRDVKPENIILAEDHACLVDFGLALALGDVDAQRLTASGLSVGTPHYLSPEQASAEREIGPRADQYALACVLFEMLVGEPPFTGPTASSIAMRHISETPTPMRVRRKTVPAGLEAAVLRAMEKVPADRFASVRAFGAAAHEQHHAQVAAAHTRPQKSRKRVVGVVVVVLATAIIAIAAFNVGERSPADVLTALVGPSLDSTVYAVLPFRRDESGLTTIGESEILYDAIQRWNGVEAVDPFRIRDEVARNGAPITTSAGASRVAERLRAGRYIWGDVSTTRGRVRVHATLYETRRPGRAVREQTIQLASAETNLDSAFAGVAELLLFGRASTGPVDEQRFDTQSRPARIAFLRGRDEATTWNLAAADSLFRRATELDPAYARAYLWLAQVRSWGRDRPADLRTLSEKALANSGRLSPDDQRLATALGMIARGEYGNACAAYSAIVRADSTQFAAWYGLGECNAKDDIVLRDGDKLRFRSSYREALASYERAFTLLPTINRAFGARAYSRLQRLVKTSATDLRYGHAVAPDTMQFAAHPELINDTLAFTPFPLQEVEANSVRSLPASLPAALALQRRVFARIAAAWVAAMPDDASALEALAVALELAQDPSAIDTVHRARGLALTGEQRLRLAAREAIVRVKFAVPGNTSQLRVARALAESLLTASRAPSPAEAQILLPLAALTGDIVRAVALTSAVPPPPIVGKELPRKLLNDALALEIYSAFGGPSARLREQAQSVEDQIRRLEPGIRDEIRQRLQTRSARLAFPVFVFDDMLPANRKHDQVLEIQKDITTGKNTEAMQRLDQSETQQARLGAGDVAIDAVVSEATLLAALGEYARAERRLARTLDAVSAFAPSNIDDVTRAASLVRGMVLRSQLASCLGDARRAAQWRGAAEALWLPGSPAMSAQTEMFAATKRQARHDCMS